MLLPRSAAVQAAVDAALDASREIGLPVSSIGYWVMGPLRGRGRGAARFSDRKYNPPSLSPPYVLVDLTGGHTRGQVIASLVRAVMMAARTRRRAPEAARILRRSRTRSSLARAARPASPHRRPQAAALHRRRVRHR